MSNQSINDTPTHRTHLLQMPLKEIEEQVAGVRARRAIVVEKIKKAKANSKLSREAEVNKQLKNLFAKLQRKIDAIDDDIESINDSMNKARALILELSDFEVDVNKLDESNSNGDEGNKTNRGDLS